MIQEPLSLRQQHELHFELNCIRCRDFEQDPKPEKINELKKYISLTSD